MQLMDLRLHCPQCDQEIWSADTTALSRTEFEWRCPKCEHSVHHEIVPE